MRNGNKISIRIAELRQEIFVIQQLIERDRKRNISSTFMGELWEIINPLINMIVMVLVFGKMFGNASDKLFSLYVLTGTTIYGLFTSGTTMCLNALSGNKNFLIKTQLKKNIYVLEKVLLAFRNFLFSIFVCNSNIQNITELDMAICNSRYIFAPYNDAGNGKATCNYKCKFCGYYIFLQDIYTHAHVWFGTLL